MVAVRRVDPWPELEKTLGLSFGSVGAASSANWTDGLSIGPGLSLKPKPDGERTTGLTSLAGQLLATGMGLEFVTATCLFWNSRNTPPLAEDKVLATCKSMEATDRVNHPNRAQLRDSQATANDPLFDINMASIRRFIGHKPAARQWLLDQFLPAGIVCAVVSPGGVGKSQLLMQLAYTVATSIPLAGLWTCGNKGAVLMLCAEDDESELHRRFHNIDAQLDAGATKGIKSDIEQNLFIRSTIGENTLMTSRQAGPRAEVQKTLWPQRLIKTAAGIKNLKLIILDPASRFRGGEENSNEDGTRFVEALEYVAQATGATVLIAHHANKASITGGESASQTSARGASSLTDGVRWQLSLMSVNEKHKQHARLQAMQAGHYLEAALVKTNYTAPQAPVYLRREQDGYLQTVQPQATTATPDQNMIAVLDYIATLKPPVSARRLESDHSGQGKPLALSQRVVRHLIVEARLAGLVSGNGHAPLKLTKVGECKLNRGTQNVANAAGGRVAAQRVATKKINKIK